MGVKKFKPTTPGRRFATVSGFEEITRTAPERSLLEPLRARAGRNDQGRVTVRHQGGGHKRQYRIIDFKRDKDGVAARVAAIEYDPNRSARIALITYAVKLVFTSFLTVVTLCIALLPLAGDLQINPWIMIMIILIASEVWFFRFQVDWHTLAFATTDGKGFSYPLMNRINPIYALAYIAALVAAIPYWRFLGLL